MSGREKLVRKFLEDRSHITIEDCDRLLEYFGYTYRKSGGSHHTYHKKGDTPVTVVIPKHSRYVKPAYVDLVVKKLLLEEQQW